MTVKLIATDLDATFLHDDKGFNEELFQQVLSLLKKEQIYFVIATGNHPDKVARYFKNFLGQYQLIANNGAQIIIDGQLKFIRAIPKDSFAKILAVSDRYRSDIRMGMVFTGQTESYMLRSQAEIGDSFDLAATYFQNLKQIDSLAEIDEEIAKITLEIPHKEHDFIETMTAAIPDTIHVTTSGYGSVDIVNGEVNKGRALMELAQYWHLDPSEMMAFGDGLNDLEMLNYVGQPVIMPNSDERLLAQDFPRALADNNHDGVLQTILSRLTTAKYEGK